MLLFLREPWILKKFVNNKSNYVVDFEFKVNGLPIEIQLMLTRSGFQYRVVVNVLTFSFRVIVN